MRKLIPNSVKRNSPKKAAPRGYKTRIEKAMNDTLKNTLGAKFLGKETIFGVVVSKFQRDEPLHVFYALANAVETKEIRQLIRIWIKQGHADLFFFWGNVKKDGTCKLKVVGAPYDAR